MNEATQQLFELISTKPENDNISAFDRVKALVDSGADINARDEEGFNVLQKALWVEAPDLSMISSIISEAGYVNQSAWYVDACLRNGFKCSREELTQLLSVYCWDMYELEEGDPQLICTLLEMGADWNCKNPEYPDALLLETIACYNIKNITFTYDKEVPDLRYKMLCAYRNAGGDLNIRDKAGRHIWEYDLNLTALTFFLEYGVDVPAGAVKNSLAGAIDFCSDSIISKHILEIDIYNLGGLWTFPNEKSRYETVMGLLVKNTEKYPFIFELLAQILPGFIYDDTRSEVKPDFYQPAEIYLQTVKEKYGDLRKAIDGLILSLQKNEFQDLGEFFKFALPEYPEIANYFPWEKLNADAWGMLLGKNPQFAEKFGKRNKISEDEWEELLWDFPELAKYRK